MHLQDSSLQEVDGGLCIWQDGSPDWAQSTGCEREDSEGERDGSHWPCSPKDQIEAQSSNWSRNTLNPAGCMMRINAFWKTDWWRCLCSTYRNQGHDFRMLSSLNKLCATWRPAPYVITCLHRSLSANLRNVAAMEAVNVVVGALPLSPKPM